MKKILIFCLHYYWSVNANAVCLNKILSYLSDYDITLVTDGEKPSEQNIPANIHVITTKQFNGQDTIRKQSFGDQVIINIGRIKRKLYKNMVQFKTIADVIVSLNGINFTDYSAIISLSNPVESHFCASYFAKKYHIPWIAYYLDPFSSNFYLSHDSIKTRIQIEKKLLKTANMIFLTDPISKEYIQYGLIDPMDKRVITTKIPGIFPIQKRTDFTSPFDKKYLNFVYMGNLHWDIRNPIKTIEFFQNLDERYRLYFFGTSYGKTDVKKELEKLKLIDNNRVFFMPPVSPEDARQIMLEADVLVNIGNTSETMIPSKIFDYISSKNNILNISKIQNDPTTDILSHYPHAITIQEDLLDSQRNNLIEKINNLLELHNNEFSLPSYYEPFEAKYIASKIRSILNDYPRRI